MLRVVRGDCVKVLRRLPAECVDAVVTDPPYGLAFMGKKWDTYTALEFQESCTKWGKECLRVLKPGGYLLAFGGTRTYHRLTCGLEDAGFEVRDCVMWLYGQGFPKSHDVSKAIDKMAGAERKGVGRRRTPDGRVVSVWTSGGKYGIYGKGNVPPTVDSPAATAEAEQWEGWGTALKPSHEPIVVCRKPFKGTMASNVLEYGTGALNIDGCRVSSSASDESKRAATREAWRKSLKQSSVGNEGQGNSLNVASAGDTRRGTVIPDLPPGRWPANVTLDTYAASMLDAQSGVSVSRGGQSSLGAFRAGKVYGKGRDERWGADPGIGDTGGASRFFYTAKASSAERNAGLDGFISTKWTDGRKSTPDNPRLRGTTLRRNSHPTVKPIDLMRWLVRLVTPPNGIVLDPFCGSGTTGIACALEGFRFVGIDNELEYVKIARARIEWWDWWQQFASDGETKSVIKVAKQYE